MIYGYSQIGSNLNTQSVHKYTFATVSVQQERAYFARLCEDWDVFKLYILEDLTD